MKLPVSATVKKVRARFTSIVRDRLLERVHCYLSKFSIVVTGNFRLWMRLILTKLGRPDGVEAIRLIQLGVTTEGLTIMKAKKKAAKKPAKKAAKKKKR